MSCVSSSLRLSGEFSEVTRWGWCWERDALNVVRPLALVGVGGQSWTPSEYPTLGSFLYGDQVECSPIPLKGLLSLQISWEDDRFHLCSGNSSLGQCSRGAVGDPADCCSGCQQGRGATLPQIMPVQLSLNTHNCPAFLKRKTISK